MATFEDLQQAVMMSMNMLNLPHDWDDEGAEPISPVAWERMRHLLIEGARNAKTDIIVPTISPGPGTGIDVHWVTPDRNLLLFVAGEGDASDDGGFYGYNGGVLHSPTRYRGKVEIKGRIDEAEGIAHLFEWVATPLDELQDAA